MTKRSDEKEPERPTVDRDFERVVKRMLDTPPRLHKPKASTEKKGGQAVKPNRPSRASSS